MDDFNLYGTILTVFDQVEMNGAQPGDPKKGAEMVVDIVKGEGAAAGKPIPANIVLGEDSYEVAKKASEEALIRLEIWKDASCSTDYEK